MNVPTTKSREATGQFASSVNLLLPDALATGNLTIVPNSVVREITVDRNTGLANGAHFVDRRSRRSCDFRTFGRFVSRRRRALHAPGLAVSRRGARPLSFDQFYVKDVITCVAPRRKAAGRPKA
jgi:hypothetical protein